MGMGRRDPLISFALRDLTIGWMRTFIRDRFDLENELAKHMETSCDSFWLVASWKKTWDASLLLSPRQQ